MKQEQVIELPHNRFTNLVVTDLTKPEQESVIKIALAIFASLDECKLRN